MAEKMKGRDQIQYVDPRLVDQIKEQGIKEGDLVLLRYALPGNSLKMIDHLFKPNTLGWIKKVPPPVFGVYDGIEVKEGVGYIKLDMPLYDPEKKNFAMVSRRLDQVAPFESFHSIEKISRNDLVKVILKDNKMATEKPADAGTGTQGFVGLALSEGIFEAKILRITRGADPKLTLLTDYNTLIEVPLSSIDFLNPVQMRSERETRSMLEKADKEIMFASNGHLSLPELTRVSNLMTKVIAEGGGEVAKFYRGMTSFMMWSYWDTKTEPLTAYLQGKKSYTNPEAVESYKSLALKDLEDFVKEAPGATNSSLAKLVKQAKQTLSELKQ